MTFTICPKNLIKIKVSQLEAIRSTLALTGFSLQEILEYDGGAVYERWLNSKTDQEVTLDINEDDTPNMSRLIDEVIDCWLELREIRELLSEPDEQTVSPNLDPMSPHDRFMSNLDDWKGECETEKELLKLIFGENLDVALLSFYALDQDERDALLQ